LIWMLTWLPDVCLITLTHWFHFVYLLTKKCV